MAHIEFCKEKNKLDHADAIRINQHVPAGVKRVSLILDFGSAWSKGPDHKLHEEFIKSGVLSLSTAFSTLARTLRDDENSMLGQFQAMGHSDKIEMPKISGVSSH